MEQAARDLDAARDMTASGHYEWACFAAHQAAEKAGKALHQASGTDAWGHSAADLFDALGDTPADVREKATQLDHHYIPTRYPDAWPSGAPSRHYTSANAEAALADAEHVLRFARNRLSPP